MVSSLLLLANELEYIQTSRQAALHAPDCNVDVPLEWEAGLYQA